MTDLVGKYIEDGDILYPTHTDIIYNLQFIIVKSGAFRLIWNDMGMEGWTDGLLFLILILILFFYCLLIIYLLSYILLGSWLSVLPGSW